MNREPTFGEWAIDPRYAEGGATPEDGIEVYSDPEPYGRGTVSAIQYHAHVATVHGDLIEDAEDEDDGIAEVEANARLIAGAPALLRALRGLVAACTPASKAEDEAYDRARDAIDAATNPARSATP